MSRCLNLLLVGSGLAVRSLMNLTGGVSVEKQEIRLDWSGLETRNGGSSRALSLEI